jgi:hypothetical protein
MIDPLDPGTLDIETLAPGRGRRPKPTWQEFRAGVAARRTRATPPPLKFAFRFRQRRRTDA